MIRRPMEFLNGDAWYVSMPYTKSRGRFIFVTSEYWNFAEKNLIKTREAIKSFYVS
jgi:hypothetical protein